MIVNRAEGLAKASLYGVLLVNILFFLGYFFLILALAGLWFRLSADTLTYLFAVLFAMFYASRRIVDQLSQIEPIRLMQAVRLALRVQIGFILGASMIYFLKEDLDSSRLFLMIYGVVLLPVNSVLLLFVPRLLAYHFYPNQVKSRAVVICDRTRDNEDLKEYLSHCERLGVQFKGYVSEEPCPGLPMMHIDGFDRLRELRHQGMRFDALLSWDVDLKEQRFDDLINFCHEEGIRVQIQAKFANALLEPVKIIRDRNLNFIAFPNEPLEDPLHRIIKRTIDLSLAIPTCLFLLAPLTVLVWVVQRRQSPGPLFYRQVRYGMNRVPFEIIKFRSMHVDQTGDLVTEARQATRDDPRVYSFGRFLRKSSLDEFPQFWNVLRGEMSIVGPRPHPIKLDEALEREFKAYRSRHYVKPGITGLAQANGFRGEITSPEQLNSRIRKDLDYIYNWSPMKDISIIFATVLQLFLPPDSAY